MARFRNAPCASSVSPKRLSTRPAKCDIGIVHVKALVQRDRSGEECGPRVFCAIEEPRRIQSLGIEVRKHSVHASFQIAVCFMIGHFIDQEQHVKLRARRFSTLRNHIVPTEMNGEGHIGKLTADVFGRYPVVGIVRMIVVAVQAQACGRNEIVVGTITVLIRHAYIVTGYCGKQG